MSRVVRKPVFAYAKTKTQISFAVTAKLISAFVFATQIVQSLYFLNMKLQASSHLLWQHSPVCVGPGRKPRLAHIAVLSLSVFSRLKFIQSPNRLIYVRLNFVRMKRILSFFFRFKFSASLNILVLVNG